MDIFNHFSCHTHLPVLLDDLIEHIRETGVVASIEIFALDLDPAFLRGFCYVFVDKPRNSVNHHTRAWIGYSTHLTREEARLVIAKELLHLLDDHRETAQTRDQVSDLIDQVALDILDVSPETVGPVTASDWRGELFALAVLLPRDALAEMMQRKLSPETIAKLARLPEDRVRLAMTPVWDRVLDSFQTRYPSERQSEPSFNFSAPDADKNAEMPPEGR